MWSNWKISRQTRVTVTKGRLFIFHRGGIRLMWGWLVCLSHHSLSLLGGTLPLNPKLDALCLLKGHLSEKHSTILYWGGPPHIGHFWLHPRNPTFWELILLVGQWKFLCFRRQLFLFWLPKNFLSVVHCVWLRLPELFLHLSFLKLDCAKQKFSSGVIILGSLLLFSVI